MRWLLLLLLLAPPALAAPTLQLSGQESFPSPNELSLRLGYQASFGAALGNPSGFLLALGVSRHLEGPIWFDAQLINVFGGASAGVGGGCYDAVGTPTPCSIGGGSSMGLAAGLELRLSRLFTLPIVLEVPLLVGADLLYGRECGDVAVGIGLRPGARARWFLLPNLGVGVGVGLLLGGARHGAGDCHPTAGFVDFYGGFDIDLGGEWVF